MHIIAILNMLDYMAMASIIPVSIMLAMLVTTFDQGLFSFPALACAIGWVLILWILITHPSHALRRSSDVTVLPLLAVTASLLSLFIPAGIYITRAFPEQVIAISSGIAVLLVFTYCLPSFATKAPTLSRFRFIIILIVALLIRVLLLRASPAPIIDVFTFLKEAPAVLLSGHNPYAAIFSPVHAGVVNNYYTYWPASLLLELPFVWLFSDPRVLLVLCDLICAGVIYVLGKRTTNAQLYSILYLFRPNATFILEQSWLASLEVAIFLFVLLAWSKQKYVLSAVFLAILVGVKQQYLFLLPVFLIRSSSWRQQLIVFSGTLSAIVLPFFLWDPTAFYQDTVAFLARDPTTITNPPILLSITINSAFHQITERMLPHWFMIAAAFGMILLVFSIVAPRSAAPLSLRQRGFTAVFVLLSLYLWNAYAFINYYYAATGVYLAAVAIDE